jgi:hypothetical protein
MTIVALHHTDKDLFAIADGLISRGTDRVIAEDQKIVLFTPRYQIPQARLGHFDGFSEYSGLVFGLAYAGNYTIIATVVKRFTDIVNRLLFIDRDTSKGGKPTIYQMSNAQDHFRSFGYDDTYNFRSDELVPITVNFLMNILQRVCAQASADFHTNAMTRPDAHFAIFGTDRVGHDTVSRCQIIRCVGVRNGVLLYERFSTLPWRLNCIGDVSVIPGLIDVIESNDEYATPPVGPAAGNDDFAFLGAEESAEFEKWTRSESIKESWCAARESIIEQEVLRVISRGLGTIGGDCTIARSGWTASLTTRTMKHSEVCARFDAE